MASLAIKVSRQGTENAGARPHLITIVHPTEHLIGQALSTAALRAEICHLVQMLRKKGPKLLDFVVEWRYPFLSFHHPERRHSCPLKAFRGIRSS